jgi:hypothetical protein
MKGLFDGCEPSRIRENIKTLTERGIAERQAIGMAHAHAKKARKAKAVEPAQALSMSESPDQV